LVEAMAKFSQSGAQGRERARASFYNTTALGLCMACALTLSPGLARAGGALPHNGQYVAGQGSITSGAGSVTVNQSSSHGIINWQGFSIGQGNSVVVYSLSTVTAGTGGTNALVNETGGLVGLATGGTINHAYAAGPITISTGTDLVGGIAGNGQGATIKNVYWDEGTTGLTTGGANISGPQTGVGGTTGLSPYLQATYSGLQNGGWLFVNGTRPMLAMEYSIDITNAHQLQLIATQPGAGYTLENDIDLSATENGTDVWSSAGFVPVNLGGAFNGQGYTISNLYENNSANTGGYGLFRSVRMGASVDDLVIDDANVTGAYNVGALAGANYGMIQNVLVDSSGITPTTVTGEGNVGGLVGMNVGSIGGFGMFVSDGDDLMPDLGGAVSVTAAVSGQSLVGGLVGWNRGSISDGGPSSPSTATGTVSGVNQVGGFVGWNDGTIFDGQATDVSVTGTGTAIGGFVGLNSASGSIQESTAAGYAPGSAVNGTKAVGGFAGANNGSLNEDQVVALSVGTSSTLWSGGFVGWNTGFISSGVTATLGVAGSDDVGGFVGLNQGSVGGSDAFMIGASTVLGVYNVGGFVGSNTSAGTIVNSQSVTEGGAPITATNDLVGGFAGSNAGDLDNDGAAASVSGSLQAGGFVGWNETGGDISNSEAIGSVAGVKESGGFAGWNSGSLYGVYATGTTGGTYDVGGLVGINQGSISNAYATAAVSASSAANAGGFVGQNGGSISFAYATGPVQGGGASTGGFVGNNFSTGTIFAGYWDAQTTMQGAAIGNDQNAQSGNVMDMTTVELQSGLPLNFVGSIWGSDPTINDGLPYLLQLTDSY
jgi:The GLUG motif